MNIQQKHFVETPSYELTASQIGIGKWNWISAKNTVKKGAQQTMKRFSFDVLPITRKDGQVLEYFKTREFGKFEEIEHFLIKEEDKLYYRTRFLDIIKNMIKSKRTFYFLCDSENILGLISINNLNSIVVYNYLYQIISNLEKNLSMFLQKITTEEEIVHILENTSDTQANETAISYKKSKSKNSNNTIYEHLYFSTISTLLKNLSFKLDGEYSQLLKYRKKFSPENTYGVLRNKVAHPIKPIFKSYDDLILVNDLMDDAEKINQIVK